MSIKQRSKGQLLLELMMVTRLRGLCRYIHNSCKSVTAMAVSSDTHKHQVCFVEPC